MGRSDDISRIEYLEKKAIRRYIDSCDWDEVINTLSTDEKEEWEKLTKKVYE